MGISKSSALAVALVGSLWGVPVAHAENHEVFATANVRPMPGSAIALAAAGSCTPMAPPTELSPTR